MTLRSFGLNQDIYDKSVGVAPVNGDTLFVYNNYYSPYITLSSPAGTLWGAWLSPTGSFNYGAGAASGIGITMLLGADAGDYLATWHIGQPGGAYTVVGEVFDSAGNALTGIFHLSSETDAAQFGTAVALPSGGFLAVFADSSHASATYLYQQAYGSGTNAYTAAAWLQEGFDLAGRLFDSSFNAVGSDYLLQPSTGAIIGNQWQPSPVLLHNGTIAVAYSDDHFYDVSPYSTNNSATQIRVEFLSASGALLSNLLVDTDSAPTYGFANPPWGDWTYGLPAAHPTIFSTAHGFGLLWQANGSVTYGPSTGDQVHWLNFQLFDNAGHAVGAEVHLRDDLASVNYDAFFRDYSFTGMQLANGHVVVAYSVNLAGGREVFLQEFTAGGTLLGNAVQVSTGAGYHDIGALYADAAGHVVVGVIAPDGHQDLLTFSESAESSTITFADNSYNTTTSGITGHPWTTTVADYTSSGLLFRESFVDANNHLWQHYDLSAGGVGTTDAYDAAGNLTKATILQPDGSKEIDVFLIAGQPYGSTATFYDASGSLQWRQFNNTDGSHTLRAYADNQVLVSTGGNDALLSDGAATTMVFHGSFGHDTVSGFQATGTGRDVLEFDASAFANAAAVLAAAHHVAGGMLISLDAGDDILMKGYTPTSLASVDMIFV